MIQIQSQDESYRHDPRVVPISLEPVRTLLQAPPRHDTHHEGSPGITEQRHRTERFQKLLEDMPFTRGAIVAEVREPSVAGGPWRLYDVPPYVRGPTWAAILGVHGTCQAYDGYDKRSRHWGDPQLDKDIPRCHQYHPWLATPKGREALRRVLKAWASANPDLVYWQGLDSIAAPFVCLNPANEGMAYGCMQVLVQQHVHDLFLPDNASELQRRMWHFSMLLMWHDPRLAAHLSRMQFQPELYTIPWFLTLFSHVLPLDKTYRLWDCLLLHSPTMIVHVAVAITRQFRDDLLASNFNACVLFFSRNVAHVDIERCLVDASWSNGVTPPSIYARAASVGHNPANVPPEQKLQHQEDDEEQEQQEQHEGSVAGASDRGRHAGSTSEDENEEAASKTWTASTTEGSPLHGDYIWGVPSTVEEQRALSYCSPIIFFEDLLPQASRHQAGEPPVPEPPERGPWSYIAIDVRPREAYDRVHLAGSVHVGWNELLPGDEQDQAETGPGRARASSCLEQLQVTVPGYGSFDTFGQEPSPSRASSRTLEEEAQAQSSAAAVVSRVNVLAAEWLLGLGYHDDDTVYQAEDGQWPDREAIEAAERARERPPHVVCIVVVGARDTAAGECAAALIEAHVPHVAILHGGIEGMLDEPACAGALVCRDSGAAQ